MKSRAARIVLGLLAIWCVGSQALDVVLEQFLEDYGETPVLVDAGSGNVKLAHDDVEPLSEIEAPNRVACAHYIAVTPLTLRVVLPPREKLEQVAARPESPESVTRKPLVPPPIPRLA